MKKVGFILIVLSYFLVSFQLPKSAQKKITKTIATLWEDKVIIKQTINLTPEQQNLIKFKLGKNVQALKNNEKIVGYLYLSQAASRSDKIDFMVIFNQDLTILKAQVLVYREEYGAEVGSRRWLKQFVGKTNGEAMKFGDDIQNISGATISARSLTEGIKKVTLQMVELKEKGFL